MMSQLEALKETTQESVLTTPATFHYELTDCVESVGVGLVSTFQNAYTQMSVLATQ